MAHMYQTTIKMMIQCVKSAVCDSKLSYTNDQSLIDFANRHDLAHLLCERKAMDAMYRCARQEEAVKELQLCLNKAGIEFILLKGVVIRQYYPEAWMRTGADIDVLVHTQDLEKARNVIAQEMGYKYYPAGTHHDLLQSKDELVDIELHFLLLEDNRIPKASESLRNVWDYTIDLENSSEKQLKPEMLYYYHIAHMAKHLQRGGCGIRSVLDLWVLRHRTDFDISSCESFVQEHGLGKFERAAVAISEKWFSNTEIDIDEMLAEMIIAGESYGTLLSKLQVNTAKHDSLFATYMSRIFMSPSLMRIRYPIVDKCIVLLPVFWVVRWIQVFTQKDLNRVKNEAETIKSFDRDNQKKIKELFRTLEIE